MSRAFVKEDGPDNQPLPDLPISPHPNYVTPRGLAALQSRVAEAQHRLSSLKTRADRLDRLPERAAERDIRYLEARLQSAIVAPPAPSPPIEVAFGTRVTVTDEQSREITYEIVGEDEADAPARRIAPQSPLARALLGARIGDVAEWQRPNGRVALKVTAIHAIADPAWPR